MVRGLDVFREHFRAFSDRYVLIGGTACEIVMREAGLGFRVTKDLDIVHRPLPVPPATRPLRFHLCYQVVAGFYQLVGLQGRKHVP